MKFRISRTVHYRGHVQGEAQAYEARKDQCTEGIIRHRKDCGIDLTKEIH